MNKNGLSKVLAIILSTVAVASCNAPNLMMSPIPGAQHVLIINHPPPQNCKFLDPVYVTYVDQDHCSMSDINSLKNQAYALGGNVIFITPPQRPDQVLAGDAYSCYTMY